METATPRQRARIKAYGWEVPKACTKKQASAMINQAERKGLALSDDYQRRIEARTKKEEARQKVREEKWRRQYERDSLKEERELERMTRPPTRRGMGTRGLFR